MFSPQQNSLTFLQQQKDYYGNNMLSKMEYLNESSCAPFSTCNTVSTNEQVTLDAPSFLDFIETDVPGLAEMELEGLKGGSACLGDMLNAQGIDFEEDISQLTQPAVTQHLTTSQVTNNKVTSHSHLSQSNQIRHKSPPFNTGGGLLNFGEMENVCKQNESGSNVNGVVSRVCTFNAYTDANANKVSGQQEEGNLQRQMDPENNQFSCNQFPKEASDKQKDEIQWEKTISCIQNLRQVQMEQKELVEKQKQLKQQETHLLTYLTSVFGDVVMSSVPALWQYDAATATATAVNNDNGAYMNLMQQQQQYNNNSNPQTLLQSSANSSLTAMNTQFASAPIKSKTVPCAALVEQLQQNQGEGSGRSGQGKGKNNVGDNVEEVEHGMVCELKSLACSLNAPKCNLIKESFYRLAQCADTLTYQQGPTGTPVPQISLLDQHMVLLSHNDVSAMEKGFQVVNIQS